jgi:hypothetical protein
LAGCDPSASGGGATDASNPPSTDGAAGATDAIWFGAEAGPRTPSPAADAGPLADAAPVDPVDAQTPEGPRFPALYDGRVELSFYATSAVPSDDGYILATMRSHFGGAEEVGYTPMMAPGPLCAVETIGECRVYSQCSRDFGRSEDIGDLRADDGALRLFTRSIDQRLHVQTGANDGPWARSFAFDVSSTGGAWAPAWSVRAPTPRVSRFAVSPPASASRAQALVLAVASPAIKVGRRAVILRGPTNENSAMCVFNDDAPVSIPASILGRFDSNVSAELWVASYDDTVVTAGARRIRVSTVVLGERRFVTLR